MCYFFLNLAHISTDKPVFNWDNQTRKVTPGENLTLECQAEGKPPPEIRWEYTSAWNVKTIEGRQGDISVTGATSTNAGVYVCVARNKVGSVSRSVTLIMTGIITDYVPFSI